MASSDKHKDTSRHRSFKGCWTCKKKRVQCDEVRPACKRCTSRGIACGGYEIRLRWGAGIASRGKYSGAEKPVKESIPPRSKRRWDMRGKDEQSPQSDGQGQPLLISSSRNDEPQLVAQRATVNILNTPWEPDSVEQTTAINKHFEIPVSLATLTEPPSHMYPEAELSGQYACNMGGRSILA